MDSIIQYNAACFFSLAGDEEKALDCLENCLVKVGNISREWLEHDSVAGNSAGSKWVSGAPCTGGPAAGHASGSGPRQRSASRTGQAALHDS